MVLSPLKYMIYARHEICQKLEKGEAEELRAEVKNILKKAHPPKHNITKEEWKAIEKLRKDDTWIMLTVDKGVALVVMKKEEYDKKAEELLNTTTYTTINSDPTTRYKKKLDSLLKSIKTQGGINEALYKKLYPTGAGVPKFYGLPKIHKRETPLRPIVSSIGAVSYQTSKELARILSPLVGRSPYHVHNNQDLLEDLRSIKLGKDECLMSFDVKALFTSVPIEPAIRIIKKLLEEDQTLRQRTSMAVKHIVSLLEFCLRSTYFTFKGRFYEQQDGAAMGSPISPIVANLYMEDLETKAIHSAQNPPSFWRRFVDDTLTIMKPSQIDKFLQHLNSLDQNIQFSCLAYIMYFKGDKTIKSLLMAAKDKDPILKKSGVIYRFKCGRFDCDEEYIGETSRTFAERFKEHQKAPSPIFDHSNISGHQVTIDNFNIVGWEDQNLSRTIKEALYIRVNNPSLNKNIGKYHLPHIWDEVLLNTPELKLK